MDTNTQIERLIELAIVQRTELKRLVEELPQLKEHLSAEIERTFEETEPQLRAELEEWTSKQAADKTAALGVALESKIASLAKSLEESAQAKFSAVLAARDQNADLLKQAEERIAIAASEIPGKVKEIVTAELARFPRAGEIDRLRKEFQEPRGLNPRGKWLPDQTYNKLDLVTWNGDSYVSNTDDNKERPGRNAANWTLSAARGTSGGGPADLSALTAVPSNGTLLIGSGTSWVNGQLTAGAGISITVGPGAITISATDGDITLDDGTAASPSLHFTNDADTGIYRPAANTLGISTSGVQRMYVDENGITTVGAGATFDGSVHAANGNANNPSLSFTGDQDTGFFRHQPNELGIALGGTQYATLTSTTFSITPNLSTSGNLTVSGTGNLGGGTAYTTGLTVKPASDNYQLTLLQSNANSAGWGMFADTSGNLKVSRYAASAYGTAALTFDLNGAATFQSSTTTTIGGNLTVSGTGLSSVAGALNVTGALLAHQTAALNMAHEGSSLSQLVSYGADASTYGKLNITLRKAGTGVGAVTALALTSTDATLAGNLTVSGTGTSSVAGTLNVSGGFILNRINAKGIYTGTSDNCGFTWTGTNGEFSTASGSLILKSAGTTALTLDSSQNATFAGNYVYFGGGTSLYLRHTGGGNGILNGNVVAVDMGDTFYIRNNGGSTTYLSLDSAKIFIANSSTVPSANPTGGGYLYVQSGALKYRGSSGTVTTIANA